MRIQPLWKNPSWCVIASWRAGAPTAWVWSRSGRSGLRSEEGKPPALARVCLVHAGTAFIECQSGGSGSGLRAKEGESSTLSSLIECLTKGLNWVRRPNEKEQAL